MVLPITRKQHGDSSCAVRGDAECFAGVTIALYCNSLDAKGCLCFCCRKWALFQSHPSRGGQCCRACLNSSAGGRMSAMLLLEKQPVGQGAMADASSVCGFRQAKHIMAYASTSDLLKCKCPLGDTPCEIPGIDIRQLPT